VPLHAIKFQIVLRLLNELLATYWNLKRSGAFAMLAAGLHLAISRLMSSGGALVCLGRAFTLRLDAME
jgi:hypothetical protein